MAILRVSKTASSRQGWSTPQWLFAHYNSRYLFTLDAAASPHNAKTPFFYSEAEDGLKLPWKGRVWLNPPYNNILLWVERAYLYTRDSGSEVELVCLLLPVRTSTHWFQDYVHPFAARIEYLPKRVAFIPPPDWTGRASNPAEDSMVVLFESPWIGV